MDKFELHTEEVFPLDAIAPGLIGLRVVFVNVFAVTTEAGWTLIDAGLNGSAGRIMRWAREHFGGAAPNAIVLTHAHFDHVGAIDQLVQSWDVPVYVHHEELPYVTGERSYPPPDPTVGGGMMARMASLYPRSPIDLRTRARPLPLDGTIAAMPGWRWVHTPGHTAGQIALFRDSDRALIAGDAFCTTKQESFSPPSPLSILSCMGRRRTSRPIGTPRGTLFSGWPRCSPRSSHRATASRWPAN